MSLLERACKGGVGAWCGVVAARIWEDGHDRARALAFATDGCCLGDGDACETVGLVYFFGDGATRDAPRGARAWERSCQLGVADACDKLARVLFDGQGVLPDRARAEALMLAPCENGSGNACFVLAGFYYRTAALLPQETRGIDALKRLCAAALDTNSAQACYGLGVLATYGRGVPQDTGLGLKALQRACDTGNRAAIPEHACDEVPHEP
jgi:uncharacterized protein